MPYADKEKQKAAQAKHYQDNKAHYRSRNEADKGRYKEQRRDWIREYLREHPCIDCGEDNILTLEFDHKDPSTKSFNISDAISKAYCGLPKLLLEIAKCDVRCSNCHKIRTAKQFGSYKLSEVDELQLSLF